MLVTISGLSGSGKSTIARMLGERIGLPTVDVGGLFRKQAAAAGMDIHTYGRHAATHPEVDRKLDASVLRRGRHGGVILQGRMTGLLTLAEDLPAVRIWLDAPIQTRARKVAGREGTPYLTALSGLKRRDAQNRQRYLDLYGLDVNDRSVYDIVVRMYIRSPEQVISALERHISQIWRMKRKTRTNRSKRPILWPPKAKVRPRKPLTKK